MNAIAKIVPFPDPIKVQAAKPEFFLSAETKAKLLALHIINTSWLRKLDVLNR